MKVAPEFEVKLFAGEPNCVNPIAFTIDEKGRVWVVECFEYPSRTPKGKAPRDRIVILEDTDGDGACDKRTVFAEGKDFPVTEERKKQGLGAFDLASGIEVGHGGVFVGAPPYLWFIENKDDKPGKFEVLLKGFGSQDTHETLNTFQWGPDGWLYGLHGVFTQSNVKSLDGPETRLNGAVWRYHPRAKKFEVFAEGTSNPWGMDWRNTDGQFILCCCVIPHLFHVVPGGIYKRQAGASFNPYAYGYINEICDHTFHRESGWAHAGLISLDAPHIPEKYRDSVIFGSIHGCSIKQNVAQAQRQHLPGEQGRGLPGVRGQELPADQHEVGAARGHLPDRLARPEPLPPGEAGRLGLRARPGVPHPAQGDAAEEGGGPGEDDRRGTARHADDPNPYRYRDRPAAARERTRRTRARLAGRGHDDAEVRDWWTLAIPRVWRPARRHGRGAARPGDWSSATTSPGASHWLIRLGTAGRPGRRTATSSSWPRLAVQAKSGPRPSAANSRPPPSASRTSTTSLALLFTP